MTQIFERLLTMSATGGGVILLILAFRRFIRKMPKAFSYALWAVALFRLLCPVSFASQLSLLGLVDRPDDTEVTVSQRVQETEAPPIQFEIIPPAVTQPVQAPTVQRTAQTVQPVEQAVKIHIDPMTVLTFLWLAGVAGMVTYGVAGYIRTRRRLIGAVRMYDNVYAVDHLDTAFVMGVFRPKIYLPSDLPKSEERHIVAHERCHIRRLDHITRLAAFAALCVHWFNPLVWIAFVKSGEDMEMSCDETVIRRMGVKRSDYAASLLNFTAGRQIIAPAPVAFSEGNAKKRIMNIAAMRNHRRLICLALALACIVFTVACGANPVAKPPKKKDTAAADTDELTQLTNSGRQENDLADADEKPAATATTETAAETAAEEAESEQYDAYQAAEDEKYKKYRADILGLESLDELNLPDDVVHDESGINMGHTGTLIDTTKLTRKSGLLEKIKTPYELFSKITVEYIDLERSYDQDYISMYIQNTVAEKVPPIFNIGAEEAVRLLNSVREDEISVSDEWHGSSDCDVCMRVCWGMTHDLIEIFMTDGQVYFCFRTSQRDQTNYANLDLFDYQNCWKLDNAGFKELFDNAWEEYMDYAPPAEIDPKESPFTVQGEDLSQYYFVFTTGEGEIDKLVVEITAPAGVEMGVDSEWGKVINLSGSTTKPPYYNTGYSFGEIIMPEPEQTENGGTYVKYEKLPFTQGITRFSISPEGLEGCTVTVTAQPWH